MVKLDATALIFERKKGEDKMLIAINISDKPLKIRFSDEAEALISGKANKNIAVMKNSSEIISFKSNVKYKIN